MKKRKSSAPLSQPPGLKPEVVAIYCPLWHSYDHLDTWKGEGWTEWELLKTAPPRFKGHHQPLKPTWGCFDESQPIWSRREIDLAADHGIDVFLFDWYWYSGVQIMQEALERGFLHASNRQRIKFALMWANHTWSDYFPAPLVHDWNTWLSIRHSPKDLDRAIDYCAEHYFHESNYWRVNDRLFYSIFLPHLLVDQLGGAEKTKLFFSKIDRRLNRQGLPGIHWNAMVPFAEGVDHLKAAGFHSTTSYNVNTTGREPSPNLTEDYVDVMQTHREHWSAMSKTSLPHMPVVTMGWDVTPRCLHDVPWPFQKQDRIARNHPFAGPANAGQYVYPYQSVIVGNTPKRFGKLAADAVKHLRDTDAEIPAIFVNAWNEWTEGCYLLPEQKYGTGFLEELQAATKGRPQPAPRKRRQAHPRT